MILKVYHGFVTAYYLYLDYHLAFMVFNILYEHETIRKKVCTSVGIEYFTYWIQVAQQIYFYTCFACDVLESSSEPALRCLRKTLLVVTATAFTSIVFPMTCVLVVNFWLVFLLTPHLVCADRQMFVDHIVPWINHCLHSHVLILALGETLLNWRLRYPARNAVVAVTTCWITAYVAINFVVVPWNKSWPYPLFAVLDNVQKMAGLVLNIGVGCAAYSLGHQIHRNVWGEAIQAVRREERCT